MEHFKLRFSQVQTDRLVFALNENMDDFISYTEYQHALEAFEVSAENHFVGQGPKGAGYVKHQTLALERFIDTLEKRSMDGADLFNALAGCDSKVITRDGMQTLVKNMNTSLRQKDLESITKYFFTNPKENKVDMKSFLPAYNKACALVKKHKEEAAEQKLANPGADVDEFAAADIAEAD